MDPSLRRAGVVRIAVELAAQYRRPALATLLEAQVNPGQLAQDIPRPQPASAMAVANAINRKRKDIVSLLK